MKIRNIGIAILLGSVGLFGQSPVRPAFEVASVRPSAAGAQAAVAAGAHLDGAQFRTSYLTLKDYVSMAYRVKLYQISGPDWFGTDRFDVQVVPYTMSHTNLGALQIRDRVNLECDMVGKYVVRAAELAGLTIHGLRPGEVAH